MLEWNVYIYNINARKMEIYNVFNHSGFVKDLSQIYRDLWSREERAEKIRNWLKYYFWCRTEWEIIIRPWVGDHIEEKIDVFNQINMNFDKFVDYVEAHKEELVGNDKEGE